MLPIIQPITYTISFYVPLILTLGYHDLKTFRLPNKGTIPGILLGLLFYPLCFQKTPWTAAVEGMAAYGIVAIIGWLFQKRYQKTGIGQGDYKLIAMISIWWGLHALLDIITWSSLSGILWCLLRKKCNNPTWNIIPFGFLLSISSILWLILNGTSKANY
jgi:leader peptidase (prepilin peptidase) / N-methyltransferase